MGRIFLTSDTHFGHDRLFIYEPRGFLNIQEHDKSIIEKWNSIVKPNDIVYHLGDVMLGDNEHGLKCLRQLNGQIKIIIGNHDTSSRVKLYKTLENIEIIGYATVIKYNKYTFYLSHYPTLTSNLEKSPNLKLHVINLFGHTHQEDDFYKDVPYMFHCGMDSNDCTPVLLDDAIEKMKEETQKCLEFLGEENITA